jgi:hypothetical protein
MSRERKQAQQPRPFYPDYEVKKADDYKLVYATGMFGGLDPNDARIIFYCDRVEPEMDKNRPGGMRTKVVHRELQVEIHMSPLQFKTIARFMNDRVKRLEKRFGELTSSGEEEDTPIHIS